MCHVRIKRKGICEYLFILFCVLFEYHLLYIIPYRGLIANILWVYSRAFLLAVITIVYWIAYKKGNVGSKWLDRYTLFLFLGIAIGFIYTLFQFPAQEMLDTIRVTGVFFIPAASIIFFAYFKKKKSTKEIIETINIINFIWNILIITQSFLYQRGIVFLDFNSLFLGEEVYMRYGSFRVYAATFADCMIIYNFSVLYESCTIRNTRWLKHLVAFVLGIYCMLVINQTKAEQVYVFFCLGLIMLIGGKNSRSKIITMLAIVSGIILIYNTEYLGRILSIFGTEMRRSNSVSHRLYAYQYYAECIKRNPLFGNGFAMTTNVLNPYYSVEHGPLGFAFYSDVGIVGLIANTGLLSFIIFIWPMIHIGKNLRRLLKKYKVRELSFQIVFYIYLWVSTLTLITTDANRMIQFAFAIAYYEYIYVEKYHNNELLRKEMK